MYLSVVQMVHIFWYKFIIKTLLHIDKYIENASEGASCTQATLTNRPTDRTNVPSNSQRKVSRHEFEFVILIVLVWYGIGCSVFLCFFLSLFCTMSASHLQTLALIAQEFASDSRHVRAWNIIQFAVELQHCQPDRIQHPSRSQLTKCERIYI